jgi:hypothetical protein
MPLEEESEFIFIETLVELARIHDRKRMGIHSG